QPARSDELALDPIHMHQSDQGNYEPLLAFRNGSYNQVTLTREEPDSSALGMRASTARLGLARIDVEEDGLTTAQLELPLNPTRWLDLDNFRQKAWNTMLTASWRAVTHDAVEDRIDRAVLARQSFLDS